MIRTKNKLNILILVSLMKRFFTQEYFAFQVINSCFMLDALSSWAKEDSKKYTLDEHLWNTLRDHISAHYSVYSIDHIQSLLSTFRNQENDRLVSQQNQCRSILEVCLQYMANTYFEWRHGTPMIRSDKVLQVQQWLAECNPEPIQCYLWAIDYEPNLAGGFGDSTGPHHRQLSEEALKVLLHGPLLSAVDDPTVQRLRQEGLAEIHRHLNGTILPSLLWSYLIHAPQRLSPKNLAGDLDGLKGHDCIALLRTAGDLRTALLKRLLNQQVFDNKKKKKQWNREVIERLTALYDRLPLRFRDYDTFQLSGLPDYRDPAALLPLGEDEPLIGERAFLYYAFRLFHESTNDAVLAATLHAYILIQNLIWRALIQSRFTAKGFDRFDRYHGLFLRRHEKDNTFSLMRERYLHRLIQAQRTGGVRWIELRTTPFDGVLWETRRLKNALESIQKSEIADRGIELERLLKGFNVSLRDG